MKWGFLGASRIGERALAPAVLAAGHTLLAVGARDAARAQAFADGFGVPRAYGSYEAVLADPQVEAVYVALPNNAHLPWTVRALEAGKHVLCEKPLALNAAEVAVMQDAERRSGKRAMEAFCHVFQPRYARVREIVEGGGIGRLVGVQGVFGIVLPEWPGEFRWTAGQGGGALYDLGCYCVSAMRVLTGREPHGVSAIAAMRGEVDETLTGLLDFGAGVGGSFTCSFASAKTQQIVLLGSEGRLALDWPFSVKGRATRLEIDEQVEEFAAIDPYVPMVQHFAAAALGQAEMMIDLAWSLRQARVLDALLASAASGASEAV